MSARKGDNREKLLVVAVFIEKVIGAEGKTALLVLRIGIQAEGRRESEDVLFWGRCLSYAIGKAAMIRGHNTYLLAPRKAPRLRPPDEAAISDQRNIDLVEDMNAEFNGGSFIAKENNICYI